MKFTKLRASGFKSFADAVELDIEAGLTGIVGPNGCGKSNVVEALRWVMGESSAKGLRSQTMDDVIFNGNAIRPAFDLAEVSLKLHGPFQGVAAEFDEIQVSRRLNRKGGSHYRVNGRESRARDLSLIFADAGSGARSPAIIGQGQVSAIIDCKPSERRRLLEDQAGIGGLHDRRREAELKLAATEKNLERVFDGLEVQDQRLGELGKQAKQAARYIKLSKQIRELEWQLIWLRCRQAEQQLGQAEEQRARIKQDEQEVDQRLQRVKAEIKQLSSTLHDQRSQMAPLVSKVASARERLQSKRYEIESLQSKAQDLARLLDQTHADLERERADRASLIAIGSDQDREQASLRAEQRTLESQKIEARGDLDSMAAELAQAEGREREMSNQLAGSKAKHDHLRANLDDLVRQKADLERDRQALTSDLDHSLERRRAGLVELDQKLAALDQAVDQATQNRETLQAAHRTHTQALDEQMTGRDRLRDTRQALEDQRREQAHQIKLVRDEGQRIEQALAARRSTQRDARSALAALDQPGSLDAAQLADHALQALQAEERKLGIERDGLDEQRRACTDRLHAETTAIARLDAEAAALGSSLPLIDDAPIADRLTASEQHREALAAAFGEQILCSDDPSSTSHWRALASDEATWPPLPNGVQSLSDCAQDDDPLQRRLGQTGLIDPEAAWSLQPALKPGQQLVSADGGLWRWDGFVRKPQTESRLQQVLDQRARLLEIEKQRQLHLKTMGPLSDDLDAIEARHLEVEQQLTTTRERCKAATDHAAETARQADRTLVETNNHRQRLADLDAEIDATEAERASLPDLAEAETACRARESDLSAIDQELAIIAEQLEQETAARGAVTRAIAGNEETINASAASRREAVRQRQDLQRDHDAMRDRFAENDTKRRLIDQELGSLTTRHDAAKASFDELDRQITGLQQEHRLLAAKLAHKRQQWETMRNQDRATRDRLQAIAVRLEAIDLERDKNASLSIRVAEREKLLVQRLSEIEAERTANSTKLDETEAGLAQSYVTGLSELEQNLTALESVIADLEADLEVKEAAREKLEQSLTTTREQAAIAQSDLARAQTVLERLRVDSDAMLMSRDDEAGAGSGLFEDQAEFLEAQDIDALDERLIRYRQSRERMGAVNLRAEIEADELQRTIDAQHREVDELNTAIAKLQSAISTLNKEGRARLLTVFEQVDHHFRILFQGLFGGGKAHLRLTNLDDPFNAGLELDAMPPGKKLQSLTLLSGGEKSLASLALIMALFKSRPSPLCVLDEVDAALDDVNVERFTRLLKDMTAQSDTKFLVVTHHPHTMAVMDRLYGVTMQERGVSKLVSVALDQAVSMRESA